MTSASECAKREHVKLVNSWAAKQNLKLSDDKQSSDEDVNKAFTKVSLKAHIAKEGEEFNLQ